MPDRKRPAPAKRKLRTGSRSGAVGPAGKAAVLATGATVPRHDLLEEPILTLVEARERRKLSLPEVLEALGSGRGDGFALLQAHQRHAWHAFLVQLAAMAMHRAGEADPALTAGRWREILLAMTDGERAPWCLVVPDLTKPGFMQPPVPEGTLEGFKEVERPDLLDVPILAKNHDLKRGRIWAPEPEHWVFVLVSAQTMHGYTGRGNYGIARMNGGYGSRPGVGLAPSLKVGSRFVRDVGRLTNERSGITKRFSAFDGKHLRHLIWLEPWNGKESLLFHDLDPWFIEVSRRIRLVRARDEDGTLAMARGTEAPRFSAEELAGVTGDPWTPVDRARGVAFSATGQGFDYRTVQQLLGARYDAGAALRRGPADGDSLLVASVIPRGQGKTGGFHERTVPVPAKAVRLFDDTGFESLAARAQGRVERAGDVKGWLKLALLALVQGDPPRLDWKDERSQPWLQQFESGVDGEFFEQLWEGIERPEHVALREWESWLVDLARRVLRVALAEAPMPEARRYRAIAAAEGLFEGTIRKKLPHLFETAQEEA